MQIAGKGY